MGGEDDGFLGGHLPDDVAHLVLLVGIEAVRGLVEDEHGGIVEERLRKADALLVALREGFDGLPAHRTEVAEADDALDVRLLLRGGAVAPGFRDEAEKLLDGHLGVGRRVFRQVADQALDDDGFGRDIVAGHQREAGGRTEKAGDHLHRGRFAGAVRPQKSEDVAAPDREGDAIHRAEGPVVLNQTFDFDHGNEGKESNPSRWENKRNRKFPAGGGDAPKENTVGRNGRKISAAGAGEIEP